MSRCTTKSKRSEEQCKNWAMRKKSTCRFHGGCSTGPKTIQGREKLRQVHYKHGLRSKKNQQERKKIRKFIKDGIIFLNLLR